MTAGPPLAERYGSWIDHLAEHPAFGPKDRRGTANYIDDPARRRAVEAMRTGRCAPLARPLQLREGQALGDGHLTLEVSNYVMPADAQPSPINAAFDQMSVVAHGQWQTHLDGLNHCGFRHTWYSGFAVDDPDGPSIADLADEGLFTRGVLVDIPAVRGSDWVDAHAAVTGEDIEAALRASDVTFQPGDALLLYMGRDRFEAAGQRMDLSSGNPTPGAGAGAAEWIVDNKVSILCWDFLDGVNPLEPRRQIHSLIWAIGLLLVDNCNLGPAADMARRSRSALGALVVAPPPLPAATGCLVNPLFIQ